MTELLFLPEWVLVIVGIITAAFIGWQSWETRKAAQATLLNAQALIASERAWLLTERIAMPASFETGAVQKSASAIHNLRNYGRTPAIVLAERSELQYGTMDGLLTNQPPDPTVFSLDGSGYQRYYSVPTNGDCPTNPVLKTEGSADAMIPWVCGRIRYRDVLREDVTHETWYCLVRDPRMGGFRPGPREYNRIT